MDKKYIKAYWKEVNRRALEYAKDNTTMKALIIALIILITTIGISGLLLGFGWVEYPFFKDNLFAISITGISQIIISLIILFVFFIKMFCKIPPEIHKEQEEKIKKLEENYISPNLNFSVMSLGKSFINKKEYASIIIENTEDIEIDDFYAVITGFASQKYNFGWEELIEYINPGGERVSINGRADNEKISLGNKGGKVRFDIVKQGDQEIIVLNQNAPHSIQYGDEFKITITFKGISQGKLIKPTKKIYQLSCAYRNQEKSTGITIFEFKEYGGKGELFTE